MQHIHSPTPTPMHTHTHTHTHSRTRTHTPLPHLVAKASRGAVHELTAVPTAHLQSTTAQLTLHTTSSEDGKDKYYGTSILMHGVSLKCVRTIVFSFIPHTIFLITETKSPHLLLSPMSKPGQSPGASPTHTGQLSMNIIFDRLRELELEGASFQLAVCIFLASVLHYQLHDVGY